ncbi:hypothetical protein BGZ61DRAFT_587534 [Ilyonectria robusta]|uniref:uncharacterized protein n=1 Tax=Ilyonectria robusta TaxID=1079257 RepID=UPI001E8DB11C|nr:uncharacterized protein BGZ61DRAFT_587534 [Ilyonectria robusta]KAH8706304.1 hypothetical protein BGZ61DRAFT_587534 [Ilyonectria robusta]
MENDTFDTGPVHPTQPGQPPRPQLDEAEGHTQVNSSNAPAPFISDQELFGSGSLAGFVFDPLGPDQGSVYPPTTTSYALDPAPPFNMGGTLAIGSNFGNVHWDALNPYHQPLNYPFPPQIDHMPGLPSTNEGVCGVGYTMGSSDTTVSMDSITPLRECFDQDTRLLADSFHIPSTAGSLGNLLSPHEIAISDPFQFNRPIFQGLFPIPSTSSLPLLSTELTFDSPCVEDLIPHTTVSSNVLEHSSFAFPWQASPSFALGNPLESAPSTWVNHNAVMVAQQAQHNDNIIEASSQVVARKGAHRRADCTPGESSHSKDAWNAMWPIFEDIYQNHTLEESMMVLLLVHNFEATKDEFKNRLRKSKTRKNRSRKRPDTVIPLGFSRSRGGTNERTRLKTRGAIHEPYPYHTSGTPRILGSIPRNPAPQLYHIQTKLLLCIDKYVNGFFDSRPSPRFSPTSDNFLKEQTKAEWHWQIILNRCRVVSAFVRKKKEFTQFWRGETLAKPKINERFKAVMGRMIQNRVFDELAGAKNSCSPYTLISLWDVCRILEVLPSQLGSPEDEMSYVSPFICTLRSLLHGLGEGHYVGLANLLQELLNSFQTDLRNAHAHLRKANADLQEVHSSLRKANADLPKVYSALRKGEIDVQVEFWNTLRISCLCTARAFTTRLGANHPAVLNAWAIYFRHWDIKALDKSTFLESYEKTLKQTQDKHGHSDDCTISLLHNYTTMAYYVCRDYERASRLADELWSQTKAPIESRDESLDWTVKVQGMTEAAKIRALLLCINQSQNNKQESATYRKHLRHKLNLRSRWKRRKRRLELELPPRSEETKQAIDCLDTVVGQLSMVDDWDSNVMAAGLSDCLVGLTVEYYGEDAALRNEVARRQRDRAREIRSGIISFQELVQEPPA